MPYTTLITPADLQPHLAQPDWVVVDCRFSLTDEAGGHNAYLQAHIPQAVYAQLKRDLAGPPVAGHTSRHPLPSPKAFAQTLSRWGIDAQTQVVAYDDNGGALAAARLWWMLRWVGHTAVAVLDGGWQAWMAAGYPVARGEETRPPRRFTPHLHPELLVDTAAVEVLRTDPRFRVVDSRGADRYRGENETLDPIAGHIPGAISGPYAANLDATGHFLSPEALRARFQALLGAVPSDHSVFYCGSGVTAAHNLLAEAYAGLDPGRLYAGSWSEWITDPARPIATGPDPLPDVPAP
jgi:thiosulfate/3-mercaptopyruvate sulfurtransferase